MAPTFPIALFCLSLTRRASIEGPTPAAKGARPLAATEPNFPPSSFGPKRDGRRVVLDLPLIGRCGVLELGCRQPATLAVHIA